MTDELLDLIESSARGELRGMRAFAHPLDTLLLVMEVRKLREALKQLAECDCRKAAEVLR